MNIVKSPFGKMSRTGQQADLYTLTNDCGMIVSVTNYGGTIVTLTAPDRAGKFANVNLGYDTLAEYEKSNTFFGCLLGRITNRIGGGKFTLNGVEYKVTPDGKPALHGGAVGFDKVLWTSREVRGNGEVGLELTYLSEDGDQGFPGNLSTRVTYALTNNNELRIEYSATTDKDTVINLSNHAYFNLAGAGEGDILGHVMMIPADNVTEVDDKLIATGRIVPVKGTPLDFNQPTPIGQRILDNFPQLRCTGGYKNAGGYDHNFVLRRKGSGMELAARVVEPKSGRVLEVLTTEPAVQFYSGNFMEGNLKGFDGKMYAHRGAFCLETQHYPDSPNQPNFPSVVLKPGKEYRTMTIYRFMAE